ncbi:hypothetical protein B2J93_2617 [Marssonina coronariae]|uniref:Uncharacterized protein n=1 Tax=Diplocarpon coronariae TaxID=2795749 RepID=A0A218Z7M8_9HELO|nr:hypothetical protein B2J93_2617 [Marssonina coronariae]
MPQPRAGNKRSLGLRSSWRCRGVASAASHAEGVSIQTPPGLLWVTSRAAGTWPSQTTSPSANDGLMDEANMESIKRPRTHLHIDLHIDLHTHGDEHPRRHTPHPARVRVSPVSGATRDGSAWAPARDPYHAAAAASSPSPWSLNSLPYPTS